MDDLSGIVDLLSSVTSPCRNTDFTGFGCNHSFGSIDQRPMVQGSNLSVSEKKQSPEVVITIASVLLTMVFLVQMILLSRQSKIPTLSS